MMEGSARGQALHVLYVCNDQGYFQAHRRWLADQAQQRGMAVSVACGAADDSDIQNGKVQFPLDVERHRFLPFRDMRLMRQILNAVRRSQADVVHLITIKPILFGLLGLRLLPGPRRVVATFPGLGRIFDTSETSAKARLRRWLVKTGLKIGLSSPRVVAIFEKEADRQHLLSFGVISEAQSVHIPGSGVDPAVYAPAPMPPAPLRVLFAGRLLRSKGVMMVLDAARLLRARQAPVEVVVAGGEQRGDPDGLDEREMADLAAGTHARYLGALSIDAMPALLAQVHAVLLPTSYQEGVPRILIEAGAVGRTAIVSSNPGCTAFVDDERTGLVLREDGAPALADAIARLATEPGLLERLAAGAAHRVRHGGFEVGGVGEKTFALYRL